MANSNKTALPEIDMTPIVKLALHDVTVCRLFRLWEYSDIPSPGEALVAMVVALAQEKQDLFKRLVNAKMKEAPSWLLEKELISPKS